MKKYLMLLSVIVLLGCHNSPKVEQLPDAKLNEPYSIKFRFSDSVTSKRQFHPTITPENSGLSITPTSEWYNTVIISGTPKVKQDILIEISYTIKGPVGWFEDRDQEKYYKIKVKE